MSSNIIIHITKRKRKPHIKHHRQADDLRARFKVPEWRVFCHTARLRKRPARLKLVLSDGTILGHGANTVAANYCSGYALGVMREHMEKAW